MKFLLKILKGGMIGIAAVIPGFSGGTIACIMGCYDELIEAISGVRKHFKKSILTLLPYVIGIVVFALAFIIPISWGLDHHPLITVSLFAGLLIGGLPSFYENIKGRANKVNILAAVGAALVVIGIIVPSLFSGNTYISLATPQFWMYVVLFFMGILGSAALVIPGISGSMVLLLIGFYNPIMDTIKAFIASCLSAIGHPIEMDYFSNEINLVVGNNYILPSFGLLLCFGIGILVGFFLISKLMKFLLSKYNAPTYFAIFGFILASLVGIYTDGSYYQNIAPITYVLAIIAIVIGFVTSYLLSKLAAKKSVVQKGSDK